MKERCSVCGCGLIVWPGRNRFACAYGHGLNIQRLRVRYVETEPVDIDGERRARAARASFALAVRKRVGMRPADWPWPVRFRFGSGVSERQLYILYIKLSHDGVPVDAALDATIGPDRVQRRLAIDLLLRHGFLPDAYLDIAA